MSTIPPVIQCMIAIAPISMNKKPIKTIFKMETFSKMKFKVTLTIARIHKWSRWLWSQVNSLKLRWWWSNQKVWMKSNKQKICLRQCTRLELLSERCSFSTQRIFFLKSSKGIIRSKTIGSFPYSLARTSNYFKICIEMGQTKNAITKNYPNVNKIFSKRPSAHPKRKINLKTQ